MSDARTDPRFDWARPGSAHDRRVGLARVALPAAIGTLVALLAIAPLLGRSEISFVLNKDRVEVADERMRVAEALYRGQDDAGRPFSLRAGSAVQATSRTPLVRMAELSARISLAEGPAVLRAPRAHYDLDAERLRVTGPLTFDGSDGYRMSTRDVDVDLNARTIRSDARVAGRIPLGTFSADRLQADLDARTVTLAGRARLHIEQGGATSRR